MSLQIHGLQFQWGPWHHSAIFCSCLSACQVTTVVSDSLTVDNQAPLSMEFSRQDFWNGLPFPPLGDLPNSRIKPVSLKSPGLAGRFFNTNATWEVQRFIYHHKKKGREVQSFSGKSFRVLLGFFMLMSGKSFSKAAEFIGNSHRKGLMAAVFSGDLAVVK